MRHVFGMLKTQHWALINFKLALGVVWPTLMLLATPVALQSVLGNVFVYAWTISTFIGGIVSIEGLIMSAQEDRPRIRLLGISIELIGLFFMAGGVLAYFSTQLSILLSQTDQFQNRLALTVFAYAMLASLIWRISIVGGRRRRETHDLTKSTR